MISLFANFTKNKIARYIISGGAAAFVSLSLLYFLTDIFGFWYLFSSVLAFIAAFFVSFFLQKLWTFKNMHMRGASQQLFLYFITAITTLFLNTFFMYILVDIIGIWYIFSQILLSGILAIMTFFVYGNIIFNNGKKNRILIATGLYPPDIGGPATYSQLLETELPKRGIGVIVVSFGYVRHLPKIIRHVIYFLKVCFESVEAGTLYALDPVSVGLPTLLASKLLRKKFLLRVAGDYAWEQFQAQGARRKAKNNNKEFITLEQFQKEKFDFVTEVRRKIEHFVARHADMVITPSNYLKTIILEWGMPQEKIVVIYNAFTLSAAYVTRKKLGINGTILVSAGRLVPWKGFEILVNAVTELKREIPDIKLYIAGDGPEREKLQTTNYKLQAPVILLGRLSHDELTEYIQAADIFVLNTGYEGFSHQLLDVMALGTPIITTNVGGNSELIENQKTGIFVPYNGKEEIKKAIKLLLQNQELRGCLIKNGKEKAKLFSVNRAMDALVKIFA